MFVFDCLFYFLVCLYVYFFGFVFIVFVFLFICLFSCLFLYLFICLSLSLVSFPSFPLFLFYLSCFSFPLSLLLFMSNYSFTYSSLSLLVWFPSHPLLYYPSFPSHTPPLVPHTSNTPHPRTFPSSQHPFQFNTHSHYTQHATITLIPIKASINTHLYYPQRTSSPFPCLSIQFIHLFNYFQCIYFSIYLSIQFSRCYLFLILWLLFSLYLSIPSLYLVNYLTAVICFSFYCCHFLSIYLIYFSSQLSYGCYLFLILLLSFPIYLFNVFL